MTTEKTSDHPITLLKTAISTLLRHSEILFPFCLILFIQLLIMEILYFAPRFPLSVFFAPLISRVSTEAYLHYPFNFIFISKAYYAIQIPLFIIINGFLIAVSVSIIAAINEDKKIRFADAVRKTLPLYVYIFIAAVMIMLAYGGISSAYNALISRLVPPQPETALGTLVTKILAYGAPYIRLFFGIIANILLAFVIPIIVIERKKIFSALILNFKYLSKSFWVVSLCVLLPTLLYVPVLMLRDSTDSLIRQVFPSASLLFLILGSVVTFIIDATVTTAIATYYLLKKENA